MSRHCLVMSDRGKGLKAAIDEVARNRADWSGVSCTWHVYQNVKRKFRAAASDEFKLAFYGYCKASSVAKRELHRASMHRMSPLACKYVTDIPDETLTLVGSPLPREGIFSNNIVRS